MSADTPQNDLEQETKATESRRASEKEGIWQQIKQHFQSTQTSLSLRLVCQGREIQQIADIKSGIREAARMFNLHDSPQKAEELVASQENLFIRKCQQWEQVAKGAEAQERAKATGGGEGSASSAANRRKLEAANNAVRHRISNSKQCFRRLRTALNRGVTYGSKKSNLDVVPQAFPNDRQLETPMIQRPAISTVNESIESNSKTSKLFSFLASLIGDGLPLNYDNAPFKDSVSDTGAEPRESIWTESQPYCLIVRWDASLDHTLNLKFWIVPKRPELVSELRSQGLPDLFLHTKANFEAERLNLELVRHGTQVSPRSSEMTQLLNRIKTERFLSTQGDQNARFCYLNGNVRTKSNFDSAVKQSYLLELL